VRARFKYFCGAVAMAIALGAPSSRAVADVVTSGSSLADGLSVSLNLQLLGILGGANVTATIAPVALVQGAAPNPYNSPLTVASLSATAGTFLLGNTANVTTGIITTDATSSVDGTSGVKSASGSAVVNNLNLGVLSGLVGGLSLLSLTADTITANATVTGNYGSLGIGAGTGATLTNPVLSILGVSVSIPGTIPPNTSLNVSSILGGISIILNEQITSGNGVGGFMLTTNAIDIKFTNVGVSGIGTLNGQILIDHTTAQLSAVPEPSSMALVFAGAGVLAVARVRSLRRMARMIPIPVR
jgi:hypothetical protein